MQKILILKGLPASGKTAYALALVSGIVSDPNGQYKWKRVNKDDLRAMIDRGEWNRKNEKVILDVRNVLINKFILLGYSVVVDDTNLSPKHTAVIKLIAETAREHGYNVEVEEKFFDIPVEECIARDAKREHPVGAKVIYKMYQQFLKPKFVEREHDQNLLKALIVDIDGTLAFNNGRDFFDWGRVGEDAVNKELVYLLNTLVQNNRIIVVSGRDSCCRQETVNWLDCAGVPFFDSDLFMRPAGDMRPDEVVKKEIYEQNIKGKYDIWGVFDDRPRVIKMWKLLGLPVYNCGDGIDF